MDMCPMWQEIVAALLLVVLSGCSMFVLGYLLSASWYRLWKWIRALYH